jgi:hypothetical protein
MVRLLALGVAVYCYLQAGLALAEDTVMLQDFHQ